MSNIWPVKAPNEIQDRTWLVPTPEGDSLASFTAAVSGVTLDASDRDGDLITVTLSGGTANETATVDIVATTTNGKVLSDRFYQPIRSDGYKLNNTARDVADFALRKVTGNGLSAEAAELEDALERLSDMFAAWAGEGVDWAVKLPCEASDVLYVPDWSIQPIKACLTAEIFDHYGVQQTVSVQRAAITGLQRVKQNTLPDDRELSEFY